MNTGKINSFAVVIAALAYWLLGAAWFTILSKPWLASIGTRIDPFQNRKSGLTLTSGSEPDLNQWHSQRRCTDA